MSSSLQFSDPRSPAVSATRAVSRGAGITPLAAPPLLASAWSTGSLRADQNMRNLITAVWGPRQHAVGPWPRQLQCGENTESSFPRQQTKAAAKTLAFLVPTLAEPSALRLVFTPCNEQLAFHREAPVFSAAAHRPTAGLPGSPSVLSYVKWGQ